MAITTGNVFDRNGIVWTLDENLGPLGRTAKTVQRPTLVEKTETNEETGEAATTQVETDWYDSPRTVILFRAGKQVAVFNNVTQYFASQLAEGWVDQGE